jgi:hypothetical protein
MLLMAQAHAMEQRERMLLEERETERRLMLARIYELELS